MINCVNDVNLKRKIVTIFPTSNLSCPVKIVTKYMKLLPPAAQAWYCTPLKQRKPACWYSVQPCGVNTLTSFMPAIREEAGWKEEHVTGHSLRATCATRMAQSGVAVPLIKEQTGHRSDKSVASYMRTL